MKLIVLFSLFALFVTQTFASEPSDIKKACDVLSKKLDKPTLPTQKVKMGSLINPFIPPEVYTECTGTYDTGVPDLASCRVTGGGTSKSCAQVPYCDVGWDGVRCGTREQCVEVPNAPTTVCSNIIACNAYKTHKRFNVCEVSFTLKLPKFISEPIAKYIDSAYNTIESAQSELRSDLPLACASDEVKTSVGSGNQQSVADAVTNEIKRQLQDRLRREGEEWLARTGIETVIASIPSGGLGGAAALATNIADFVITAKNIADDYVQIKEVQTFAEDLEFQMSCHPGEWSDL